MIGTIGQVYREALVSDCYYCGVTPSQVVRRNDLNGEFVYNGIDRLDNSIGYTKANSVSCCWRCNRAKFNDDLKDFKEWVRCVYENLFIEPSQAIAPATA
jgi:hypothetical protein